MEMCNANNPAENNPLQRMPAIISALHLIFWGGLIVVIDIRINRFDIVNDVIGAFIIAAGVFRLADLPVDRTYATQMSYVRVTSVVFVVHCIVVDLLGLEATGGLQVILSLAALAEFAAIVVFCLAMRRLSNSVDGTGIDKAADTGCTTGCGHITYTAYVYPLEYLFHTGHDSNNTGQVIDDIGADECRFKTFQVCDVTTYNLHIEASKRTTVVVWQDEGVDDLPTCD